MRRTALVIALLLAGLPTAVVVGGPVLAATPTCQGEPATIVNDGNGNVLVGTAGRDVIVGAGSSEEIRGRGGDDLICGRGGRDTLYGGAGDDVLNVGPAEGSWADLVSYRDSSRGINADLRSRTVTGQGRDRLLGGLIEFHGSMHDDVLIGTEAGERIVGLSGDDRIAGIGGDDWLFGDFFRPNQMSGDDLIRGGVGTDNIYAGRGDDEVRAGAGNDYVNAWTDPLHPSGSDRINGGPGRDWLHDILGPDDRDEYVGGDGWDTLAIDTHFASTEGEDPHPDGEMHLDGQWTTSGYRHAEGRVTGINRVILPRGRWRLVGTDRGEALWGSPNGSDPLRRGVTIYGRGGNDNIVGTEYDDVLIGDGGSDQACGDGGADQIEAERQAVYRGDLCEPR